MESSHTHKIFSTDHYSTHERDTYSKKRTPKHDYKVFLSSSLNRVEVGNSYHSTNNHDEHDATGSDAEQEVLEGR